MSQTSVSIMSAKTWELTPYELQRTPQEVVTDNTEIAVSPRSLHSELMCPICLDMLKVTMTTKECLHRFCNECITTALRSGNKECPTCRKKLVSRRSLRPDPNFDALISKIYPSREEYEDHQQKVLERITKHHNSAGFANAIEEGLKEQDKMRNVKTKKSELATFQPNGTTPIKTENSAPSSKSNTPEKENEDEETTSTSSTTKRKGPSNDKVVKDNGNTQGSSDVPYPPKRKKMTAKEENNSSSARTDKNKEPSTSGWNDTATHNDSEASCSSTTSSTSCNSMELQLHPHPQQHQKNLDNKQQQHIRNIKTSVVATMHHVSHFLTLRNMLESGENKNEIPNMKETQPQYTLYIKSNEKYIAVGYEESLETLLQKYWRDENKVQLFYLRKK